MINHNQKIMKRKIPLVALMLLISCSMFGQRKALDVISTSGSSMESEDLVVSWTIGNNIIDFVLIEDALATKPEDRDGVMQMKDGTLLKVYPTLTKGIITIKIRAEANAQLTAEFLDMKGSKLKIVKLDSDAVETDLSHFENGLYILRITNKDVTDQKLVKIVKY